MREIARRSSDLALLLAAAFLVAACGGTADSLSEPVSDTVASEPPAPEPEPQKSMAETWAESGIRGNLGMRDTEFFPQMPDGDEVTAAWSRSGVNRIHTITWSDGSQVVTYWRPSDTPSDGLRLYMIDRIGFP